MYRSKLSKTTSFITIVLLLTVLFSDCKKYPNNIVSVKKIKRGTPFGGKLLRYEVNGNDSLSFFNSYFVSSASGTKNINDCYFSPYVDHDEASITFLATCGSVPIGWIYKDNYSFISFSTTHVERCFQKNIFIDKNVWWQIIQFAENRKNFICEATFENGNSYLIEIGL
jgi:hypothetical protein